MSGGSRPKRKTSRVHWSAEEDSILIRGWLQNSADKTDGGTNWDKVVSHVNQKRPNQRAWRNVLSCKARWNYLVAKVIDAHKTEPDGTDTKSRARFAHAYDLLHAAPRFLEVYSQKKGILEQGEGSSKRPKVNEEEEEEYSSEEDSGAAPRLGDYETPPDSGDEQWKLTDPDWENSHVLGKDWKQVKVMEVEATKQVEQWKIEFQREKEARAMQQNDLDRKCRILEKLLDKQALSPAEEALKNKLIDALF